MDIARIEQILDWLVKNFISVVVIFSIFIQITPIKWNPLTTFAKWLSKIFTKELSDQIETMQGNLDDIRDDIDENEKDRIRWEVLDFANSCRHGRKHKPTSCRYCLIHLRCMPLGRWDHLPLSVAPARHTRRLL